MARDDIEGRRGLIDEAVRRVLISEGDMTIDGDKLRAALAEHCRHGSLDMFSLVRAGCAFVRRQQSGSD